VKSTITIGVPPDYEHLFAEVQVETQWNNKTVMAEVFELNTENGELTVKIYAKDNDWIVSYSNLVELLEKAKARLLGETP
jgi:hypothetical protein